MRTTGSRMGAAVHFRRLFVLAAGMVLAFVGLGARLVSLQVYSHDRYRVLAERNTQMTFVRQPRRGDIRDRNGNPLAVCVPVKRVFADSSVIGEHRLAVAKVLGPLLKYEPTDLAERLKPHTWVTEGGRTVTNKHVNLHRMVSPEHWERVQEVLAELRFHPEGIELTQAEKERYAVLRRYGIYAENDQHRVYPSGRLASHVLGYAQSEDLEFNGKASATINGRTGVESWFDEQMRGLQGWQVTEADVKRQEVVVYREEKVDARPGLNVVLTLDLMIQKLVEDELAQAWRDHDPASVSAVVVRPSTGEILAMATLPDFDPNRPGEFDAAERRNRVIADEMEPGSTFKIVTIAGAINDGLVGMRDAFDCEQGQWLYQGKFLKDHHSYGVLTVEDILMKSSNIGAAKIGIRLGKTRLHEYVRDFGFGDRTGVTLAGERLGTVHPPRSWDNLTISRIPMGHAVAVTHLQMTMAMSALANGGRLMRPMLVQRLEQEDGSGFADYHPQEVRKVVSRRTAALMVDALKRVVSPQGTAPQAALDHYTVAGKTGTAQKPIRGRYVAGKYITSFIGFFPADEPEVCISVVLDEPKNGYYGGSVAGPIFKRIAEQIGQYLKIRPDLDPELKDAVTGVWGVR